MIYKLTDLQHTSLGDRRVSVVASDGSIDRDNDWINPNGWQLGDYRKNPVVLFAHDSHQPPVARCLDIRVIGDRLVGEVQFAPPEMNSFADSIYRMVLADFLNGVSVGFLPLDYSFNEARGGYDHLKQSLLEFSFVPVPSNVNALVTAKQKGINLVDALCVMAKTGDGGLRCTACLAGDCAHCFSAGGLECGCTCHVGFHSTGETDMSPDRLASIFDETLAEAARGLGR